MRLFIAINFTQENKDILGQIAVDLSAISLAGKPVRSENQHLTLAFIGESEATDRLCQCMDKSVAEPFELIASRLGCFKRPGGDIIWLGVKPAPELFALQANLAHRLREAGFAIEKRQFKPHLTLLRQAVMPDDFDWRRYTVAMPEVRQQVSMISLMKSERIAGQLIYTSIYDKHF